MCGQLQRPELILAVCVGPHQSLAAVGIITSSLRQARIKISLPRADHSAASSLTGRQRLDSATSTCYLLSSMIVTSLAQPMRMRSSKATHLIGLNKQVDGTQQHSASVSQNDCNYNHG